MGVSVTGYHGVWASLCSSVPVSRCHGVCASQCLRVSVLEYLSVSASCCLGVSVFGCLSVSASCCFHIPLNHRLIFQAAIQTRSGGTGRAKRGSECSVPTASPNSGPRGPVASAPLPSLGCLARFRPSALPRGGPRAPTTLNLSSVGLMNLLIGSGVCTYHTCLRGMFVRF